MTLVEDNLSYQRKQSLADHLRKQYPDFNTDILLGETPVMVATGIYSDLVFSIPKSVSRKILELRKAHPELTKGVVGLAFDKNFRIAATVLISGSLPAGTSDDYETRLRVRREMVVAELTKNPELYLISQL